MHTCQYLHRAGIQYGTARFVAWLVSIGSCSVLAIAQEFGLSVELHRALGIYGRSTKLWLLIHPSGQA